MIDLAQLDDATAERVLTTIARARSGSLPQDLPDLRKALREAFVVAPSPASASAGELARQALTVLAEDPTTRIAIESMAREEGPISRHTFDGGATIALGIAAFYALSTAIDVERDKQGKWSFKMKVRPASQAAVTKLVEKLINYLPG
jgi:hypothetical protein